MERGAGTDISVALRNTLLLHVYVHVLYGDCTVERCIRVTAVSGLLCIGYHLKIMCVSLIHVHVHVYHWEFEGREGRRVGGRKEGEREGGRYIHCTMYVNQGRDELTGH